MGQRAIAGSDARELLRIEHGDEVAMPDIDEARLLQAGEAAADGLDGETEPIGEIAARRIKVEGHGAALAGSRRTAELTRQIKDGGGDTLGSGLAACFRRRLPVG